MLNCSSLVKAAKTIQGDVRSRRIGFIEFVR
jgi:hypothetical protein